MFGFGKRKAKAEAHSKADATIAVMDDAIRLAAERWTYFCDTLPFRKDVALVDRITAFMFPFMEGARKSLPALRDAPDAVLLVIVAKGIERSRTHSRTQIEEALGLPLPD